MHLRHFDVNGVCEIIKSKIKLSFSLSSGFSTEGSRARAHLINLLVKNKIPVASDTSVTHRHNSNDQVGIKKFCIMSHLISVSILV